MKNMQKLFALLLAVVMVLSMAVTAFADTTGSTPPTPMTDVGTITINGAAAGTQYTIYRILDVAKTADGKTVYITNPKWADFIDASDYFTISNGYISAITLTELQLQQLAQDVITAATDETKIDPDGTSAKLTNSGIYTTKTQYQYGFYVMTSDRNADKPVYSVFTLNASNVEVDEKNEVVVTIQKAVQEDSDVDLPGNGWGPENNAEIGQEVQFKIEVKVAAGKDVYTITDSMPNFKDITVVKYEYSNGNVPENGVTYQETSDGFTVTINTHFRENMLDGEKITIYYKAKLKAEADLTAVGNVNSATLTYYDKVKEENVTIDPAVTTTYTYKLEVNKWNENNQRLAGAKFILKKGDEQLKLSPVKDTEGNKIANTYVVDPLHGSEDAIVTDNAGILNIYGLDTEDTYTLVETEAPQDPIKYIPMEPLNFEVHANENHTHVVHVTNMPGVEMPSTGGMGTTILYAVGGIMVLAAVVLLVTKKRMSA